MKFKVGDKFLITKELAEAKHKTRWYESVEKMIGAEYEIIAVDWDCMTGIQYYKIIGGLCFDCKLEPLMEPKNNLTKTIMTNIIKFVKNMTLSSDDKLLIRTGLKNEAGEYTVDYQQLSSLIDQRRNEKEIIEYAKKMEAEEKK
jgi:hypothetical protein